MGNSNTSCKIRFQEEISLKFEVKVGLKQGNTLSSFLFNLAFEVIREVAERRYMKLNENVIILRMLMILLY